MQHHAGAALAFAMRTHDATHRLALVRCLLQLGASVSHKVERGYLPLHLAALSGDAAVVQVLLQAGADRDARDNEGQGTTPLHVACQRNRTAVIRALLAAGADVNKVDMCGIAPLHLACKRGDVGVVQLLLGAHADVHARKER